MQERDSYYSSTEQRFFAIEELRNLIKTETDINKIHAYEIALVNLGSNNLLEREDEIGYGYRKIAGDIDNLYDKLNYTLKAYDRLNKRWKLTKAACRLVEEYMVRIESSATQYNYAAN